jgi:hypothetical protein
MSKTLLTGEKKIRDIMTLLLLSERALPDWGLHPKLPTMVDRRVLLQRRLRRGTARELAPPPTRTLPSFTTGGLSAPTPIFRWKVRCHLLWIDGSQPPVHASLLAIGLTQIIQSIVDSSL